MAREFTLIATILVVIAIEITQGVAQTCTVKPSFASPFVVPYWDEIVPVLGCSSRALAHRSQEVHVIYLKNDEPSMSPSSAVRHHIPEVKVHLSPRAHHGVHDGRLILILHAQKTVYWRLIGERISNESHHAIVVTRGSQIIENKNLPIVVMRRRETAITQLISRVIKRYKAVTAFAEMSQATKIFIKVGIADNSPRECNIDGRMPSPNVDASLEVAVSTELQRGCVVLEANKQNDKADVHVINIRHIHPEDDVSEAVSGGEVLRSSTGKPGHEETLSRHRRQKTRVVVEVRSKSGAKGKDREKERNIFLVLKAPHSVVWIVRSDDFGGILKIVAEDPVERPHIPSTQVVHVKTEVLPDSADELIFYADNKYGPLVSYFEVEKANKLVLFVDGNDFRGDAPSAPSSANVTPPEPKLPRQILWPPVTASTTASFPSAPAAPRPADASASASASSASVLPPFIPSSKDLIKAQLGSIRSSKSTGVQVLMKSPRRLTPDGLNQMTNVMLMEAMKVDCLSDHMRVSLSKYTLERLGIQGNDMTLNSPACRVETNDTHFVLRTYFKECGTETTNLPHGVVIYKNAVNFHFRNPPKKPVPAVGSSSGTSTMTMFKESDLLVDDEDQNLENGSGIDQETWKRNREDEDDEEEENLDRSEQFKTLEFQCEFSMEGATSHEKESSSTDQKSNVSSPRSRIYDLQLYRDSEYRSCFRSTEFPASILENNSIYVESRIDAGPHFRVVTEECWLSVSPNESDTDGRITLIHNTCPIDLSVNIHRPNPAQLRQVPEGSGPNPSFGQWNRFSFQVNSEFHKLGPVYLHCMLGVCSVNPQHTNGNVKQCVDVEDYCLKKNFRSFLDKHVGTHHEVLTRGPIHVISRPSVDKSFQTALLSSLAPFLSREKKPDQQSPTSFDRVNEKIVIQEPAQVILIGLSTEAVVGIAFASFLIGAALTAILWFIHLRTDPLRNGRARATAPHHSGYDLSAHSGSSTPSSQVPMTT